MKSRRVVGKKIGFTLEGWGLDDLVNNMESFEEPVLITVTPIESEESHPINYYNDLLAAVIDSLLDTKLIKDVYSFRMAKPIVGEQIGVRISIEEISKEVDQ